MALKLDEIKVDSSCERLVVENNFNDIVDIERSIIKRYRKYLWTPFIRAIQEFEMVENGDHIAVCISGGKDSLLLAKLLQELQKHSKYEFKLSFIAMNPGFNEINYEILKNSCDKLNIPVEIFDTNIFKVVDKISKDYPCYMCARMRRGALYSHAKSLGCNKIALGHHYDDVIETVMINVLYGGKFNTMMPKLKATGEGLGMQLIRPMTYIRERDIINYTKYNGIQAMNCGCVVAASKTSSKRKEVKEIIKQLATIHPDVEKSIYSATKNVNISSLLGYEKNGVKHSFLEEWED